MYLVNFATFGPYKKIQERQTQLLNPYFQEIFSFNDNWIKETWFYKENKDIFDVAETGFGYCSWKPLILLEAFNRLDYGSVVLYSDTADEIYNQDFFNWAKTKTKELGGRLFNLNYYIHKLWTKRDCFVGMGCDSEKFWEHRQLEAGTFALEKNDENINLLNEWLILNTNKHLITKIPNILGKENFDGFVDHRTDQSILTNLVIRNGYPTEYMENFRAFIRYNFYEKDMNLEKHKYANFK